MTAGELFSATLLTAGSGFMLLAALGIVRMPDLYTRMSATSKASTLGASLVALGAACAFGEEPIFAEAAALVAFLFLTAPVAAHMIGRAGYVTGVRPTLSNGLDVLRGVYGSVTQQEQRQGVRDVSGQQEHPFSAGDPGPGPSQS